MNGLQPFENTIEQKTKTMPPPPSLAAYSSCHTTDFKTKQSPIIWEISLLWRHRFRKFFSLKSVFEKLRFRDGLMWTVGPGTVGLSVDRLGNKSAFWNFSGVVWKLPEWSRKATKNSLEDSKTDALSFQFSCTWWKQFSSVKLNFLFHSICYLTIGSSFYSSVNSSELDQKLVI